MNPAYIRDVIKMTDFEEMTKLSGQIRTLSRQITRLSREITSLSGAVTRLSRQITDKSGEITSRSGQITDKSGEIISLSNPEQIKQRFEEIITLSSDIKNFSEEITNLSDPEQIEKLPKQIKNLSEEITNLSDLIKNLFEEELSQKDLYEIHRDYIKHEDSLIDNRLTWLLVAETLIFYSYSTVVTADGGSSNKYLLPLSCILKITGLLIGILGLAGIFASILSINALRDKGKVHITSSKLPELTGGGDKRTESLGKFPQIGIPIIMTLAWFLLFFSK